MLKRLSNLIKGFMGLFISDMEKKNPEALLEVEKENLRKQISKYNQGLAAHAGMCERLMSQVKKLEEEESQLTAKTKAHLRAGNQEAAGQYALRLQTIKRELQENRAQLESAEETYKELVKARDVSIRAAKEKIAALKSSISEMKIKTAEAELTEMAAGMITDIGGSGDTLSRLQEMVEEEKQLAAGKARVAKDSLSADDIEVQEIEQKALADQALADFAASEGLALGSDAEPVSGEESTGESKSMGPQSQ